MSNTPNTKQELRENMRNALDLCPSVECYICVGKLDRAMQLLSDTVKSEVRKSEMKTYESSKTPSYTIESDGDQWFCHDSLFINLQESDEVVFANTPQEALAQFMEKFRVSKDIYDE